MIVLCYGKNSEQNGQVSALQHILYSYNSEQDARTPKKTIKNDYLLFGYNSEARKIVLDSCLYFHENRYYLYIAVIMSDHVHLLIKPYPKSEDEYWLIGSILHSIKSYSSKQIPNVMKHIGKVWQDGRYDILIKNRQQFLNTWDYIKQNPVKEKYTDTPENYPFLWESF